MVTARNLYIYYVIVRAPLVIVLGLAIGRTMTFREQAKLDPRWTIEQYRAYALATLVLGIANENAWHDGTVRAAD